MSHQVKDDVVEHHRLTRVGQTPELGVRASQQVEAQLVVSKTFTTRETLANAEAALHWLIHASIPREVALRQFIGVTVHPEAAERYGVPATQILRFWD